MAEKNKVTIKWVKVKNGKLTRIKEPKSVDKLLDKGFTVSKVTEIGNKTSILTFSPRTREEAYKEYRKHYPTLPFN